MNIKTLQFTAEEKLCAITKKKSFLSTVYKATFTSLPSTLHMNHLHDYMINRKEEKKIYLIGMKENKVFKTIYTLLTIHMINALRRIADII